MLREPVPRARFRHAADAAAALRSVDAAPGHPTGVVAVPATLCTHASEDAEPADEAADAVFADGPPVVVPASWRPRRAWSPRPVLASAGAGLHAVRPTPYVARVAERDRLWALLAEAAATGTPRAAAITGPTGVGATRLAHWVATRAAELGIAEIASLDGLGCAGRRIPVVVLDRPDEAGVRRAAAALSMRRAALFLVCGAELPGAERVVLGPLAPLEASALVEQALGLDGELAGRVLAASGGNPRFAVELVGAWLRAGALDAGPSGYRLRAGVNAEVPTALSAQWRDEVDRILPQIGAEAAELAAVLGHEVDAEEWRALAPTADPRPLVAAGIARRTASGLAFQHAMVRAAILEHAARHGRLAAHHRACADLLAPREGVAARAGRHRLASGDPAAAYPLLYAGAVEAVRTGDLREAQALLGDLDGIAAPGEQRVDVWLLRARLRAVEGEIAASAEAAGHALALAQALGPGPRLGRALLLTGQAFHMGGQLASAEAHLERAAAVLEGADRAECLGRLAMVLQDLGRRADRERVHAEAVALARALGEERRVADLLYRLGIFRVREGRLDEAEAALGEARATWRAGGNRMDAARAETELATIARVRGDLPAAETLLRGALEVFDAIGLPLHAAEVLNALGETAREAGDLAAAEAAYRQAMARWHGSTHPERLVPAVNLALTLLARGRSGEALAELDAAAPAIERSMPVLLPYLWGAQLPGLAAAGDAARWDATFGRLSAALPGAGDLGDDSARPLAIAASRAEAAGWPVRAEAVRALSASVRSGAARTGSKG
jgi:tetratricopeptide (TPR) repeat protein